MGIPSDVLEELEPRIHNIIKKQLGFSEPSLLTAAVDSVKFGASREMLCKNLGAFLDSRKATKLSEMILEAVDDYCVQRDIPQIMNRKRSHDDSENSDGVSDPKRPCPQESGGMSAAQIRAMMSNTLKELEERKKALANLRTSQEAPKAPEGPLKVPLPPPKIINYESSADKAQTIAALQAQIANRLSSLTKTLPTAPAAAAPDRPTALILDEKGRTVDDKGQEIQLVHIAPTLKANLRAKKRDELRENLKTADNQEHQDQDAFFFDPRLAPKPAMRPKKNSFKFVEPGKFQKEGQRIRIKAQLEKLQGEISTIARKTGIASATQLARLAPKSESKNVPKIEWWDALLLQDGREAEYDVAGVRYDAITNLIEHPIQIQRIEGNSNVQIPVFLTKREMKKLRRQNRREAWKEKQDKIRLGLVVPDEPKVKLSNLMRVLGTEAVQDPTKVEAHVRQQMAKRLETHQKANAERKLTPEQRKEKKMRKLKEDTTAGVHVAVYRIKTLANPAKKFKVETNAKQLFMTGCVVLFDDVNVVVVEGGPKQQKKYKQLMIHRIKWDEDTYKDGDGEKQENQCELVWEGQTKERHFGELKFKQCPTESFAREYFKKSGVEHYWDLAFSGAILESNSQD